MSPLKFYISLLTTIIASALSASSQMLTKYASSVEGIDADKISVYIEDLRTGDVVLDVNGEIPMTPASVTKLYTAATVFQTQDLSKCFETKVYLNGKTESGRLQGDILIVSTGDPTFGSSYFPDKRYVADSIAAAIRKCGITGIDGEIKIESPQWLEEPVPDGWKESDVSRPYGTGYHSFNYRDNRVSMRFSRNGSYVFTPATPGLTAKKSTGKGGESVWRTKGSNVYNVNHSAKKDLITDVANPLPEATFKEALRVSLKNAGIDVEGRKMKHSSKKSLVYTHLSPTIYEILKSLVLRSDNQMAEAMLRYAFPGVSRIDAVEKEMDLWKQLGIDTNEMSLEDGSGLSRNDKLTAYNLADMLAWMAVNDPKFMDFVRLLPSAGETGTLKSFLKSSPLHGKIVAKTGSLNGVQCYAGYAIDAIGVPTHVVVIMVNGFKGARSDLKSTLQQLLIEKIR